MFSDDHQLSGVILIDPKVIGDNQDFFFESDSGKTFKAATGLDADFVQDIHSKNDKGELCGLHY